MNEAIKECIQCFITHVEPIESFLKVCFQRDTEASLLVESHLNDIALDLQLDHYKPKKIEQLNKGLICFGKFEDGKFYRIKILDSNKIGIHVIFIDYGNEAYLDISDIRINNNSRAIRELLCVTPLAVIGYLQGVILTKPFTDELLTSFKQSLVYTSKTFLLKTYPPINLIDICIDKKNLSDVLIDLGIGKSISDADLLSQIRSISKPMYQDSQRSYGRSLVSHRLQVRNKISQPEISTVKNQQDEQQISSNNTLPIGQTYNAYITHVEDGPYSFSVQLKSHNEEIQPQIDAMCLKNPPRQNLAPLLPGSQILGRSRNDGKFKRAVVMQVKSNACKVYFMDYGTTDELPQSDIYILPQMIRDLAHPQAMAFCLANMEQLNLPDANKDVFTRLILNKQVLLRVTKSEVGSLTQCCEMFLDGKNVREILYNIASPLQYTNQFPPRGREIPINVSFVDCPSQFFVQYRSEVNILGMIQDSLNTFCPTQERIQSVQEISIGTPIGSLYNVDNMWYRALVIGIDENVINILYVDYGNRDNVTVDKLCYLNRELVTKWRSQAVECCLIGFENATPDPKLAEVLEDNILGGHFTLKLQYLLGGNRLVIDLIDEKGSSVVSLLNDFVNNANQSTENPVNNQPVKANHSPRSPQEPIRGGGDGGSDSSKERFSRTNTDSRPYSRQYNKHSEHDDRFVEDYDSSGNKVGSERYKKKWDDRRGSGEDGVGVNWREEARRSDENERTNRKGTEINWRDETRRSDDNSRRGADGKESKITDNRSGRGERTNRYGGGERSGGRFNEGGDRREKFGNSGNRYNKDNNDDDDKNNDYGSSGNRFSDRGNRVNRGDRKFSGDHDNNKYGDRKTGDRNERGGTGGRFGGSSGTGERGFNRSRDQGDRSTGGRRNNEKKPFDNSLKTRDSYKAVSASNESYNISSNDCLQASPPKAQTTIVREYQNMAIVAGESYSVYFSVMGNEPNSIYLQMEGCIPILDELRETIDNEELEINSNNNRSVPKELLTPGLPVLARFADDTLLYRAMVRNHSGGKVTVLFVDFGNFAQVPLSDLYTVTPALATKPVQALRIILNDIKPASGKWDSDHSIYTPYYENVITFKVNMLKSIDGEIVGFGSLIGTDGKTVSQALIEAGLALPTNDSTPAHPNPKPPAKTARNGRPTRHSDMIKEMPSDMLCELDILVGQRVKSIILHQKDSTNFIVSICAADVAVQCILEEGFMITSISADTDVILDVIGIEGQKLIVNIYDPDGKIISDNANELSKTISPICQMPVISTTRLVYVSHFNGEFAFIQTSSSSKDLTTLLDNLYTHYSVTEEDCNIKWENGMLCCVLSSDGNWYRGKIINCNDEYTVKFIDYGNTEIVTKDNLRQLISDFYTAELCLPVKLPFEWLIPNPPLMDYVDGEQFNCIITRNSMLGQWFADLTFVSTGEKLIKKLNERLIAKEKDIEAEMRLNAEDLIIGSSIPIVVSHVDSPTMFWIQFCSHLDYIEELQQKLQNYIETMPKLNKNIKIFAAKYTEDDMWYRAIASDDKDNVRFIDYGNTDPAPLRRELPTELCYPQEGFAILLYLNVKPTDDIWSEEAIKLFETFIEKQLIAKIINIEDKKILVDLKSNDESLSRLLIEGNHGTYIKEEVEEIFDIEITNDKPIDVYIVGVENVNSFYVQILSETEKLTKITDNLLNAHEFDKLDKINIGDLIAAKYIDELWYRAKISCVDPLQAVFLDYGNCSDITEFRKLPDELQIYPGLAKHCSLNLDISIRDYTDQLVILANDGTTVFKLLLKTKGNPNIIDLEYDGKLVSELLTKTEIQNDLQIKEDEQIIKNCIICHANGPYDFYLHTPSSQELIDNIEQRLSNAYTFPSIEKLEKDDLIAVLSPENDKWYRCKIVDIEPEIGGYFIDYGNGTLITEYRNLPDDIKTIPELAIKCSLQLPDGIGGWSAEAVLTFTELVNTNMNLFDVIVITKGEQWVVELITNDKIRMKITEELLKLCPMATPVTSKPSTRTASPIELNRAIKVSGRCHITHINSPKDFFVRDINTSTNLEQIALALTDIQTKPIQEPYNIDDLVIAKIEGEYFRAKIIEIKPLKVSLIDIGNISDTTELLEIPETIRDIPPTTVNCTLEVPEGKYILTKKSEEVFISLVSNNVEFNYKILNENNNIKPEIELLLNGENILNILSETQINNKKDEEITIKNKTEFLIKLNTSFKVKITHIENLKQFYIQEISPEIDLITNSLLNAETFNELKTINIGDLIAAYNGSNKTWYRAKIINLEPKEVFSVDFGNKLFVDKIKELPRELIEIPYKCISAELILPENIDDWNNDAEIKFVTMCDEINEFDCVIISQKENICVVKLSLPVIGDISSSLILENENSITTTTGEEETLNKEQVKDEGEKPNKEQLNNKTKKTTTRSTKIKSVAEIKANAKPRIVTRSTSVPIKSGRGTPSPVHRSKVMDSKLTKSEPHIRRSISFEDKIIPGCVSGNISAE